MNNKIYDILKWVAIIVMPALATLVTVVFNVWNIPYGDQIAQTITAVATFLGAVLMVSNAQYKKANS
jgi:phosphatidylserine synthase